MKRKKAWIFLMALVLLIQPVTAMASVSDAEPATQEQEETEPADGQSGITKEQPDNETAGNPSDEKSEEENQPEGREDSQEGTEEQETDDETSSDGQGEDGPAENEITETEITETEAAEKETVEGNTVAEGDAESQSVESRIVLELPMLEGTSPFDFIMDPQGLITATNAAKYGEAKFEEGATLYFKNTDGDYEYSHMSDRLSIVSRSNVPVGVTVEFAVEDTDGVELAQNADFSGDGSCSMYLALLDSDGNETAVDADGKAVFQMVLPACEDENGANVCSFALTGCCNPDGNWSDMERCPRITVKWTVEPMVSEEEGNGL